MMLITSRRMRISDKADIEFHWATGEGSIIDQRMILLAITRMEMGI